MSAVVRVGRFVTGEVRIGPLNLIRGGERVTLGEFASVMRFDVLNAIPDHDCTTAPVSILELGAVLSGEIAEPGSLVGGVPAKVIRPLDEKDLVLIRRRTREDIPPDLYGA